MASEHFKPILCPRCQAVVWHGISWAGFERKLDITVLTIEEEIIKRLTGFKTFQLHKTHVSFEAIERCMIHIKREDRSKKVVLAEHRCQGFTVFNTVDMAPNYWPATTPAITPSEGVPF